MRPRHRFYQAPRSSGMKDSSRSGTCLLSLLFCLALSANAVVGEAANHETYLFAGQSNMDGRGRVADLIPAQRQPLKDAVIFYHNAPRGSEGWQPLVPGYSIAPGYRGALPSPTFGLEIGFARALSAAQSGHHFAFIKVSKGGTSLTKDWNPGVKGQPDTQGPCYRDLITTLAQASEALTSKGGTITWRGAVWHQGESDAGSTVEVYEQRLKKFINRLREDLGQPDLPVVVGEVFDNGKRDSVLKAQRTVALQMPHVGLANAQGLKTSDAGTHFDAASQLTLGERCAQAMLKLQRP